MPPRLYPRLDRKRGSHQLQRNGIVERSGQTDEEEFYQLLAYEDYVDLEEKLTHWELFYNLSRLHGVFNGKAPYEALRNYKLT